MQKVLRAAFSINSGHRGEGCVLKGEIPGYYPFFAKTNSNNSGYRSPEAPPGSATGILDSTLIVVYLCFAQNWIPSYPWISHWY